MTNEHTSLKNIPLTLYSKWLWKRYVWEVSWRLNKLQHINPPPVFLSLAELLSRSAGLLNRGSWGHIALCWVLLLYSILFPTNWLQISELPVAPGYIIVCRPPASCERRICTQFKPSTVKVISWYLWPDATFPWLTAGSKVSMLEYECK